MPKIIVNSTINLLFLNCSRHFGNFKLRYGSFRVLFDKIASVYLIGK